MKDVFRLTATDVRVIRALPAAPKPGSGQPDRSVYHAEHGTWSVARYTNGFALLPDPARWDEMGKTLQIGDKAVYGAWFSTVDDLLDFFAGKTPNSGDFMDVPDPTAGR